MQKIILMLFLVAVSSNAVAEWVVIGVNDGGNIYADSSTILEEGEQIKIWALADYEMPRFFGKLKPYKSIKVQTEFDCKEKQSRGLAYIIFSGNMASGESENISVSGISGSDTDPKKFRPVQPSGAGHALLNFACKKRYSREHRP